MKILFITATRIGDAVISTGVLSHLVEKHPGAEITVACGPLAASLFAAVPGLKDVIVLEKKPPASGHWFYLWGRVVCTRWDLVVDLRRSLIPYLISTKEIARLGPDDRSLHRVEFLSTLFDLGRPQAPQIWIHQEHQRKARNLVPNSQRVIAVSPIAARPEKTWPIERFSDLVNDLTVSGGLLEGAHVMAIGAEEDRDKIEAFTRDLSGSHSSLVGCDDLLTVYSVLSLADLIVTNDSGLGHLGAGTGRPTVALFGPTEPDLYRPWGLQTAVSQAPANNGSRNINDLAVTDVHQTIVSLLKSGV